MIKLVLDNLKFLSSTEKKKLFLIVLISIIVLSMDILMAALVYPLIQQLINPGNEIIFGNVSYLNKFVIFQTKTVAYINQFYVPKNTKHIHKSIKTNSYKK